MGSGSETNSLDMKTLADFSLHVRESIGLLKKLSVKLDCYRQVQKANEYRSE